MGLTGVIYAAIVVAWAIFLIPLALRRHDQTARNRSIERFSSTMRVLSTGGRKVGSRVVLTPKRGSSRVEPAAGSAATAADAERPAGATRVAATASGPTAPVRPAAKAAAARRRRVLRVLVAMTMLTGVLSLLGVLGAWAVAVPLALIVGFLVLARRQVRLANDAYWEQASSSRPSASNVVRRSAARVDASHGVARPASGSSAAEESGDGDESDDESDDPADDEPTITLTAAQLAAGAAAAAREAAALEQKRTVAVSVSTSDGGSLWDPLPITLPTYVSQAVAKRSVRNISLGEAGTWSSGHSAEDSSAVAEAAAHGRQQEAREDSADTGLDAETQRAANA